MVDRLLCMRDHVLDSANQSIHKRESAYTEQEVAKVKQVLFCQLRAVAMKEQRRDRDVSNETYLQLATALSKDTIVTRQPILHIPCYIQETLSKVLEWLKTFPKS